MRRKETGGYWEGKAVETALERERERDRDRDRDRQTDRHADTDTQTETERQRQREFWDLNVHQPRTGPAKRQTDLQYSTTAIRTSVLPLVGTPTTPDRYPYNLHVRCSYQCATPYHQIAGCSYHCATFVGCVIDAERRPPNNGKNVVKSDFYWTSFGIDSFD